MFSTTMQGWVKFTLSNVRMGQSRTVVLIEPDEDITEVYQALSNELNEQRVPHRIVAKHNYIKVGYATIDILRRQ